MYPQQMLLFGAVCAKLNIYSSLGIYICSLTYLLRDKCVSSSSENTKPTPLFQPVINLLAYFLKLLGARTPLFVFCAQPNSVI